MNNLVGKRGKTASLNVIGKAEHLKLLLLEYMFRENGGGKGYYSEEIEHLENRRTWRRVPFWKSTAELEFHSPVPFETGMYAQNEFFYVGSTVSLGNTGGNETYPNALVISNITITGTDSSNFKMDKATQQSYVVKENQHLVLKVSYSSSENTFLFGSTSGGYGSLPVLDAAIEFETNVLGEGFQRIPIVPLFV